jgi:DNA-directed RNA polymerase I subunit RPA43
MPFATSTVVTICDRPCKATGQSDRHGHVTHDANSPIPAPLPTCRRSLPKPPTHLQLFFRDQITTRHLDRKPLHTHTTHLTPRAMAPAPRSDTSLLHTERISQYVSLAPSSLSNPLPALCASIFSPLLLSYFVPARGIVLAYTDVSLSSSAPSATSDGKQRSAHDGEVLLLRHVDEYTAPFLWATATFLVWRPVVNAPIKGRITHQSTTHVTLSHLNTFPVSVTRDHMPPGWTWQQDKPGMVSKGWDGRVSDEGGCWVDAAGARVQCVIRDFDGRLDGKGRGKGFLRVEGSLLGVGA